jgi:quercetin dioxygenase-like cupin family protein
VESFHIADNVAALSVASIDPGKTIEKHNHPTMYELFFILSGEGYVTLTSSSTTPEYDNDISTKTTQRTEILKPGVFLQTAPGDFHSFGVDESRQEPLRMIYFGVTTG